MPAGMFLRSAWGASSLSDPRTAFTLDAFEEARCAGIGRPVPLDAFIAYGRWFTEQAVPDVDPRRVSMITPSSHGFRLILEDGERLQAPRVIVATGLAAFPHRPGVFQDFPRPLVSHASDHHDLHDFRNKRVIVVGGGQSAIESAALLNEVGADVEVIMRRPAVRWLRRSAVLHQTFGPLVKILYAPTDVGPPGLSWIVALPNLFRRLPRDLRRRIAARAIRPAASGWLFPRMDGVRLTTGRQIVAAMTAGEQLHLNLDDGSDRYVGHVLLATGYRVDIARYSFLSAELRRTLRCVDGYPVLTDGFESSAPGLHFLGASAAETFGPVMRFVSGTAYASRALTSHIVDQSVMAPAGPRLLQYPKSRQNPDPSPRGLR